MVRRSKLGATEISPVLDANPTDTFGYPAITTLANGSFAVTHE
jgi:hypothetical protein